MKRINLPEDLQVSRGKGQFDDCRMSMDMNRREDDEDCHRPLENPKNWKRNT